MLEILSKILYQETTDFVISDSSGTKFTVFGMLLDVASMDEWKWEKDGYDPPVIGKRR